MTWETLGKAVAGAVLLVAASLLRGWVLTLLWGWFIVGTFHQPPLSVPVAIGLALIVTYLTFHAPNNKTDPGFAWAAAVMSPVVSAAIVLGVGALVHLWVVA